MSYIVYFFIFLCLIMLHTFYTLYYIVSSFTLSRILFYLITHFSVHFNFTMLRIFSNCLVYFPRTGYLHFAFSYCSYISYRDVRFLKSFPCYVCTSWFYAYFITYSIIVLFTYQTLRYNIRWVFSNAERLETP